MCMKSMVSNKTRWNILEHSPEGLLLFCVSMYKSLCVHWGPLFMLCLLFGNFRLDPDLTMININTIISLFTVSCLLVIIYIIYL